MNPFLIVVAKTAVSERCKDLTANVATQLVLGNPFGFIMRRPASPIIAGYFFIVNEYLVLNSYRINPA